MLCELLATVWLYQEMLYGEVVSPPTTTPSTRKLTLATPEPPELSLAVAVRVTLLETTVPLAGTVRLTTGGVVSGAARTVTVTSSETETGRTVVVSRSV